jgi:hypothetical protein
MTTAQDNHTERRRQVEGLRRRALLRDVIVFQIKLVVDALKDVVLSPLSLAAAALDLIRTPTRDDSRFEAVMGIGRHLERRIALFGRARHRSRAEGDWTVDDLVERFETSLREQAGDGGGRDAARRALEQTLAGLRKSGRSDE